MTISARDRAGFRVLGYLWIGGGAVVVLLPGQTPIGLVFGGVIAIGGAVLAWIGHSE